MEAKLSCSPCILSEESSLSQFERAIGYQQLPDSASALTFAVDETGHLDDLLIEARIQFCDFFVERIAQKYQTTLDGQFSESFCELAVVILKESFLCVSLEIGILADRQVGRV